MTKIKWLTLVLLAGSTTLFGGCLGAFWDGMFNHAWPNKWVGLGLQILNEEIFS